MPAAKGSARTPLGPIFRQTNPRMAAYTKAFTGLTGMAVSKNPTHTLGVLYRYCKAIDDK